ncbi:MAG: restriction endonuclease subunit M, partial [Methanobrevibacter sp.]|nr:restriction endonuclease subunit M [Candidatus Methanoflexus mossambicus]
FYFRESISWSYVSSGKPSFRFNPKGFIFDKAGSSLFVKEESYSLNYILGLLNSQIITDVLKILSPTITFEVGELSRIPVNYAQNNIEPMVLKNIDLCKKDWDYKEISWNFSINPLLLYKKENIEKSYNNYKDMKENMFNNQKINENEINREFLEIYKFDKKPMQIEDKYISIDLPTIEKEAKNLISYFIGCLFGRYSLDEYGIICASESYNFSKYSKFIPDKDNIVPILDTEYFSDDIVKSFEEFLKVTFSPETLEENMKFIANALGNKGKTYRETIRRYFLKDFFNDHKKMYKKTPIYWQFDSGKENGFKVLIYMHRYTPDTVARVRTDYLHPLQKALETSISNNEQIIINSTNSKEKTNATKENTKLKKQLEETRKYDEVLAHVANQQIEIDLDDGVKHNYELFQNVELGNKKINLLKKI